MVGGTGSAVPAQDLQHQLGVIRARSFQLPASVPGTMIDVDTE